MAVLTASDGQGPGGKNYAVLDTRKKRGARCEELFFSCVLERPLCGA